MVSQSTISFWSSTYDSFLLEEDVYSEVSSVVLSEVMRRGRRILLSTGGAFSVFSPQLKCASGGAFSAFPSSLKCAADGAFIKCSTGGAFSLKRYREVLPRPLAPGTTSM